MCPADTAVMIRSMLLRHRLAASVAATALLLIIVLCLSTTAEQDGTLVFASPTATAIADAPLSLGPEIRVEVSGAVASPSVVELPEGSRVIDAIEAAGGWGERVDPLRVEVCINLAAPLQDGGAIRIPTLDDRFLLGTTGISCGSLYAPPTEIAATSGVQGSSPTSAPINLNTATAEQLDALPGIGPVTAAKIIAARKEGPFLVADDLVARGVISSRVLEQIRPLVSP